MAAFLESVEVLIPGETFGLSECGGPAGARGALPSSRSLEAQAMRWTYVLRTRERWLDKGDANQAHEADATQTLHDFGLSDAMLERVATASRVVVRMPFSEESEGWAGRVFPWEYVVASATRRHRRLANRKFTIMRELHSRNPAWQRSWQPGTKATMLFVESAPGRLRNQWEFTDERKRLAQAIGFEPVVLSDPTLDQLSERVRDLKPDLVHLSGFDNAQGLRALRDLASSRERVEANGVTVPLSEALQDERGVLDGMLLAGHETATALVSARQLADALTGQGTHCAYFVGISLENSAARTAPLIVGARAALTAVGFQDAIENALVDFFFELVYSQFRNGPWDAPLAFEQAWLRARQEPDATRATGIALWAGAPLMPAHEPRRAARPAELRLDVPPQLLATPATELNYSVLHNNGQLFEKLIVERGNAQPQDWLEVNVELHVGAEPARYSRRFLADRTRFDMTKEVHVPLTASLMRSLQEAVNSALVVQLTHNDRPLLRETHRLRLLPVDQWRDNDQDGQWLPSFVLPRDPAVASAVEQAQRYVRVLRDNPAAGFEGYQAAPTTDEEALREVDLQVQAIWATLLHEWRLGYINPPPTYSSQLDSQRLRMPSTVLDGHSGTCIDLALLFAACLELIDVYPVIFLLNGHALPGYWRHCSFQEDYQKVRLTGQSATAEAGPESELKSSGRMQRHSWQAVGRDAYREVRDLIRGRQLVPVETVRLTEHCGFFEAIEAGIAALSEPADFHSVLDIVTARIDGITPLPIVGAPPCSPH